MFFNGNICKSMSVDHPKQERLYKTMLNSNILTLVRPIICYCFAAVNQLSGEIFLVL